MAASLSWSDYSAWAESMGIRFFHNVHIEDLPEPYGRGVVADETIPSKKVVFSTCLQTGYAGGRAVWARTVIVAYS